MRNLKKINRLESLEIMMSKVLDKDYFEFLRRDFIDIPISRPKVVQTLPDELLDANFDGKDSYDHLLDQLYKKELFYNFEVANDCNRAIDGLELRNDWRSMNGQPIISWNEDVDLCTFLEMMCGLAMRVEFEMWDVNNKINFFTQHWFWVLANNAGFTKYTDLYFETDPNRSKIAIHDICEKIQHRLYDPDGTGGFFPSDDTLQINKELWYQMDYYVYRRKAKIV